MILLTVLFQYLKYNCSRVLPELLPPSCSFVLVPCCSLPNVLTALWFGQSINLSVILHSSLQFLFLYFCSGSLRPFSFPLSPSTSSPLAPAGSSSNSSGLWRVCVCVFVCKFVCASMRVGVLCEVNGLQDPLGCIPNVLTGSRVMTKTACLSLTESERASERERACLTKLNNSAEVTHLIERLSFTQSTGSSLKMCYETSALCVSV